MPQRLPRPPGSTSKAFTLVELIIVVVILGIIAALTIPQLGSACDIQVVSAAKVIASDLQYAQNVAITSQKPTTVTFDLPYSYRLTNASGPLINPIKKGEYQVDLRTVGGMSRVSVTSANFSGAAAVTFDEMGVPTVPGGGGVVTISAGTFSYRIDVAPATGRVTVAEGS